MFTTSAVWLLFVYDVLMCAGPTIPYETDHLLDLFVCLYLAA